MYRPLFRVSGFPVHRSTNRDEFRHQLFTLKAAFVIFPCVDVCAAFAFFVLEVVVAACSRNALWGVR